MVKRILLLFVLYGWCLHVATGQERRVRLQWDPHPRSSAFGPYWHFEGARYPADGRPWPVYETRLPLPPQHRLQVSLVHREAETFSPENVPAVSIADHPAVEVIYETERHRRFARIRVQPVFREGATWQRLTAFTLRYREVPGPAKTIVRDEPTHTSKLAGGEIYKLAIVEDGIYKLDYDFLQSIGLDPAAINPKYIHILGNGGQPLPELIAAPRIDDLAENAIYVKGEDDGQFDKTDYILFYATGTRALLPNADSTDLRIATNPYSNEAYYFLKIDAQPGIRLPSQPSLPPVPFTRTTFSECQRYELDKYNLLDLNFNTEGGGREWFGDVFKAEKTQSFGDKFYFRNIDPGRPAQLRVRFASYSSQPVAFSIQVEGQQMQTQIQSPGTGTWDDVARVKLFTLDFTPQGPSPDISISYDATAFETKGWLDYIEVRADRQLKYEPGTPLLFNLLPDPAHPQTRLQVQAAGDLMLWDITEPTQAKQQEFASDGQQVFFTVATDRHRRFVLFSETDAFLTPEAVGKIANQNIHGTERADLIIIYPHALKKEAERLAAHRAQKDGLVVVPVDVEDIYNEFSSGALDPTAIRDFVKMVYDRDPQFRYLLLFGDGSYDYRNIHGSSGTHNLIPPWEVQNSVKKVNTYPSDDFFGLLSDDEGKPDLAGALDVSVGRLCVRTTEEAAGVVDKIIYYDTDPSTLGPWRTRLLCMGDDDDSNLHQRQTSETADYVNTAHPYMNATKVLFDAFPKIPNPFGERIPAATKKINDEVRNGTLVVNYFGHGGASGLAQERVLTTQHVAKWKNMRDRLPLVITASCSTTGFDDPSVKTFGETLQREPTGGAIALYSTVRAVYAYDNEALVDALFPEIFVRENGQQRTIGDILRIGKNIAGGTHKVRKFLLFGDPSQRLALPDNYTVVTDKINGTAVAGVDSVPVFALTKITVEGHIVDEQQALVSDFNGKLYVTVYDVETTFETLGHGSPPYKYKARKGIIFKGGATVTGGKFSFSFVVPKDVVSHGFGKISYYAADPPTYRDAAGYYQKLYLAGSNGQAIQDDTPPVIDLYMNDEHFVSGGLTNPDPVLLAKISDDNGVNISGSGVGHDLTVRIDDGQWQVANDYYETAPDDYTRGELRFPLEKLAEGEHTATVKAWDVANNSATAQIRFIVANPTTGGLAHVLNYPNPFTTHTQFQFEHSFAGPVRVRVAIYSVDGRLVKTIDTEQIPTGFRIADIQWDGLDDYGNRLARGVYLYKVKVRSLDDPAQVVESDFQKLVILR